MCVYNEKVVQLVNQEAYREFYYTKDGFLKALTGKFIYKPNMSNTYKLPWCSRKPHIVNYEIPSYENRFTGFHARVIKINTSIDFIMAKVTLNGQAVEGYEFGHGWGWRAQQMTINHLWIPYFMKKMEITNEILNHYNLSHAFYEPSEF